MVGFRTTKRKAHGKKSHWRNAGFYLRSEKISNGDMETGAGNPWIPTGWANVLSEAGELTQDNTVVHAGTYSLHLDVSAAGEGLETNVFAVVAGQILTISLWLQRVSGSLNIKIEDGDGSSLESIDLISGYVAYIEKQIDVTILTTGANGRVVITATGGAAEWYIDDVSVKEKVDGHSFSSSSASSESSEST